MSSNKQLRYGIALAACFWLAGQMGYAQSPTENTRLEVDRGDAARAYIEELRFSRIQKDIFYIDELNGPIPMNGLPRYRRPEPEPEPEITELEPIPELALSSRLMYIAFFSVIVLGIAYLAYRYGGGFGASFQKTSDAKTGKPRPERQRSKTDMDQTPTGLLLDRLRGMQDRREALVLLIENLLPAAARHNNIRLGRSETARDIIRRLPRGWSLLPELKRIVMTEELVQFGGRDLPERTFEDCLRRAEPILNAGKREAA